jgi:TM2 domain-containing membrane protein YozV
MYCKNCGKQLIGTPDYCPNCGARPGAGNAFCHNCGATTTALTEICVKCGARVGGTASSAVAGAVSPKSRLAATLLAFFLGGFGAHRFYIGKIGTAVTMLILTIVGYATIWLLFGFIPLAVVWVWNLIDFIMIVAGSMKDNTGLPITRW